MYRALLPPKVLSELFLGAMVTRAGSFLEEFPRAETRLTVYCPVPVVTQKFAFIRVYTAGVIFTSMIAGKPS